MTRSRKLVVFAAAFAAAVPMAAMAQDDPPATTEVPDDVYEVQTGTRIQHIVVIGAMRDRSATQRAETPADRRTPELPVTYEDAPSGN
ncbi:MAG TPA: hypothetical protein VLK25_05130 [Allosphingosinicella sp.]|nr:hypothetical protein [Allosphingosinicella sp.]